MPIMPYTKADLNVLFEEAKVKKEVLKQKLQASEEDNEKLKQKIGTSEEGWTHVKKRGTQIVCEGVSE